MSAILSSVLTDDRVERAVARSAGAREVVRRYVGGVSIEASLPALQDLVEKGLLLSLDYLGGDAHDEAEIADRVDEYEHVIATLAHNELNKKAELTIRLSTLGLGTSEVPYQVIEDAARAVTRAAANAGIPVCIAQEELEATDATLLVHESLRQDFPETAATVSTQFLRTVDDVAALADTGSRVRVCKGTYRGDRSNTWGSKLGTDVAFVRALRRLLENEAQPKPLIATHDPRLIEIAEELLTAHGLHGAGYEFQLLHGIRPLEARRLVDIGHPVRTYVPFGPDWFSYYSTRLLDRPGNVALLARSLVERR